MAENAILQSMDTERLARWLDAEGVPGSGEPLAVTPIGGGAADRADGAARLAKVDWKASGLEGFGRPNGFHDRQVDRWLGFLGRYQFRELPGFDTAADWLRAHRPATYEPGIMHGDYQFANVMYGHGAPARLAAIVDWEMATIGDPLLDLGW